MNNTIKKFTDLLVWQESHKLVVEIYVITKKFPKSELFGLTSQMRRAAVSITSNIAEGFGRHTYKEKIQFYYIARGSVTELENQVFIAEDVKLIDKKTAERVLEQIGHSHRLLSGLITKSKEFSNS